MNVKTPHKSCHLEINTLMHLESMKKIFNFSLYSVTGLNLGIAFLEEMAN